MLAGLTSAFLSTIMNGEHGGAERGVYADFLEEAALILNKPGLAEAASGFRRAAGAWKDLGAALLPDEAAPFSEIRALMLRRKGLFLEQGGEARPEIDRINAQIKTLKDEITADFPLSEQELPPFLENLRAQVLKVHDAERKQ